MAVEPLKVPSCCICDNYYDSREHVPAAIPCGHTMCGECIKKLLTGHPTLRLCPLCRKSFCDKQVSRCYQLEEVVRMIKSVLDNESTKRKEMDIVEVELQVANEQLKKKQLEIEYRQVQLFEARQQIHDEKFELEVMRMHQMDPQNIHESARRLLERNHLNVDSSVIKEIRKDYILSLRGMCVPQENGEETPLGRHFQRKLYPIVIGLSYRTLLLHTKPGVLDEESCLKLEALLSAYVKRRAIKKRFQNIEGGVDQS